MRRAAVLGSPIAHSKSPLLHRAAYAALGLDWRYDAIEVTEEALADFVASCGPEWVGLSLTMPLKAAVIPLLSTISDTALLVRAANTVVFTDTGPSGHNTDVPGMVRAISEIHGGAAIRSATVIGAGATARSALAALADLSAKDVTIAVRRTGASADLRDVADALGLSIHEVAMGSTASEALGAEVVISTVPGGAADALTQFLPERAGVLLDVAYDPWPTELARAWSGPVAGGLDLLLWQAVGQVELMTGFEAPVASMREALVP